jgi:hypothetical protein
VHNLSVLIVELLFFLFPYFEAFIAFLSGSEFYVHSETVDYRGIRQVNARGVDEIPNFSLPEIVESSSPQGISGANRRIGTWRSLAAVPLQRKMEPTRIAGEAHSIVIIETGIMVW